MKTYLIIPCSGRTGVARVDQVKEVQARSYAKACVIAGYTTIYGKKPGCNFKGQRCWRQLSGSVVVRLQDPRKEFGGGNVPH